MKAARALPWWLWALLFAAASVGGIAAVGGFDDVPIEELPSIELDQEHEGNEINTTVTDVYISDTHPVLGYEPEDHVYLVVEATLENTTNEPSIFASDLMRVIVRGVIGSDVRPDGLTAVRTGAYLTFLQPDLPTEIVYLWEAPIGSLERGDDIAIGIFEQYQSFHDPRLEGEYTAPVPVVRIDTTIRGSR